LKGTYFRIKLAEGPINNDIVRFESNNKGQVNRKHYSRVHWDTVESTMLSDGSATLTIRYLLMTNKGESITGIGARTQMTPNQLGIAKVTGEGTMWLLRDYRI
jgi:hypothetical protein